MITRLMYCIIDACNLLFFIFNQYLFYIYFIIIAFI